MYFFASEPDSAWSTDVVVRNDEAVKAALVMKVILATRMTNALSLVGQANNLRSAQWRHRVFDQTSTSRRGR